MSFLSILQSERIDLQSPTEHVVATSSEESDWEMTPVVPRSIIACKLERAVCEGPQLKKRERWELSSRTSTRRPDCECKSARRDENHQTALNAIELMGKAQYFPSSH
jgi:hypothetical protein